MNIIQGILHHPVGLLFIIIAFGIQIGRIPLGFLTLGGSGVLVAGLIFGHLGYSLPSEIQTIGVVLFVYSVGLRAGPHFLTSLKQSAGSFVFLGLLIVLAGGGVSIVLRNLFHISPEMMTGIFAGAMTSTPALAAAMEATHNSTPSIGYGVAYPLGILGVILMVQILPKCFGIRLETEVENYGQVSDPPQIVRKSYRVTNPNISGQSMTECPAFSKGDFRLIRLRRDGRIITIDPDQPLQMNDEVLVVGRPEDLKALSVIIGEELEEEIPQADDAKSEWIILSSKKFIGRRIGSLEIGQLYGVTISRIRRSSVEFVPHTNWMLEAGDEIRISGRPADIARFSALAGRDRESLFETDIFSFAVGLALGVLVGMIKIPISHKLFFGFGIAGGPLIVGLLLGHIGRFGQLTGRVPKAASLLVGELGLYFFLAVAGCMAGKNFVAIFKDNGLTLIFCGFLITIIPVIVAAIAGRLIFKLNFLVLLGMITGGMTSTPALGVLTSNTKSDIPALGYTSIYPLAVLLTTLAAQVIALM
ncbi:MAG: hypothetical protein H6757_00410 [Candidatus Omnitrophica bacterium]|nr:hypothetical protein [Candidatus Omnitrophota bacterium]